MENIMQEIKKDYDNAENFFFSYDRSIVTFTCIKDGVLHRMMYNRRLKLYTITEIGG